MNNEIYIKNIGVKLGNKIYIYVDKITLMSKKCVQLKGENGAGKSTIFKLIMGIIKTDSGKIFFNGKKVKEKISNRANIVGYLPQQVDSLFLARTVKEELQMELNFKVIDNYDELLFIFGVNELLNSKIKNLSGGEKKRLGLFLCFLNRKPFYLLDEPYNFLDNKYKDKLNNYIIRLKNEGVGFFIISHDPICSRIVDNEILLERD